MTKPSARGNEVTESQEGSDENEIEVVGVQFGADATVRVVDVNGEGRSKNPIELGFSCVTRVVRYVKSWRQMLGAQMRTGYLEE